MSVRRRQQVPQRDRSTGRHRVIDRPGHRAHHDRRRQLRQAAHRPARRARRVPSATNVSASAADHRLGDRGDAEQRVLRHRPSVHRNVAEHDDVHLVAPPDGGDQPGTSCESTNGRSASARAVIAAASRTSPQRPIRCLQTPRRPRPLPLAPTPGPWLDTTEERHPVQVPSRESSEVPDDVAVAERLENLQALTDSTLTQLDVDELLVELLARVREILDVDTAAVLLLDERADELVATSGVRHRGRSSPRSARSARSRLRGPDRRNEGRRAVGPSRLDDGHQSDPVGTRHQGDARRPAHERRRRPRRAARRAARAADRSTSTTSSCSKSSPSVLRARSRPGNSRSNGRRR